MSMICMEAQASEHGTLIADKGSEMINRMHTSLLERNGILKVEYMEPFVQAACSVLERVSGGRAAPGPLGLMGATYPTACVNIAARVSGRLQGDVVYSMSSQTAQKLAELLTGMEAHGFGRLTGTGLVRLGDMIALETGNLLGTSGISCEIGRPTVFRGLNVEFSSASPALAVRVDTDAGQVDINLAVNNG